MNLQVSKNKICLRQRLLTYSIFTLALVAGGCVQLQESGQTVFLITSPAQEAQMGAQAFADIKKKKRMTKNTSVNAQVQRVANRLRKVVRVPNSQWEVVVFEDKTPNAFALPGGKIGIYTGILPITKNDAGLAAVIGHELAHITLRHGGQRLSQQMALAGGITFAQLAMKDTASRTKRLALAALGAGAVYGISLPYSRSHEYEADRFGMNYMAKAGYNPAEAIELWKRMQAYSRKNGGKPPEFMSTHPSDANRIQRLQMYLPEANRLYKQSNL
ncbi:MAG: M48 family metallopeptidase [Verrucomicrobiota bacterium]